MWWLKWHLAKIIRPFMKPMEAKKARKNELKSIFLYILISWNLLGYAVYKKYKYEEENDKNLFETKGHEKAYKHDIQAEKIIQISLSGIQKYDYNPNEYKEKIKKKLNDKMEKMKENATI